MAVPPDNTDAGDHTAPPTGAPGRRPAATSGGSGSGGSGSGGSGSGGTGSGGTAVPTGTPTPTTTAAQGQPGQAVQPGQSDPTTPLQDDSSRINSALGTTSSGGPQLTPPVQQSAETGRYLAHHQFSTSNEKDFYNFTESDYHHNQDFAKKADAKDASSLLNDDFNTGVDGISENDRARIAAGVLDPAELATAAKAHTDNASDLTHYAQQVSGGDTKAAATADQLLALGEPGLQFFRWFYRAYHLYTGGGEPVDQLEKSYHAEQGMSFADLVADAALMTSISQGIDDEAWKLNSAASTLESSWQGRAAANFGAKMQVLFTGANTVKQDLAVVGSDINALVQGLQELVIAKAQAVNQLFLAQLPDRIDGGIAYTFAKVAMGRAEDPERRVVLGLLGMDMTGRHEFLAGDAGNDWSSGDALSDDSRKAAELAAADWCNQVLVPEYDARQNALNSINTKTTSLIQKGFAEFTGQLQHIADPFAGMDGAHGTAPAGSTGGGAGSPGGAGGGGFPGGGGGIPGGGPTIPTATPNIATGTPTVPAGLTTPQGTPSTSSGFGLPGGAPAAGTTRPAGLPPGATWIPSGVPLPHGWSQDPSTGQAVPQGWSGDPSTALSGPGVVDPRQDIHQNKDGSVSLGRDRGLTISPEHGKKGVFTLRDTGADGIAHTYRVHFDEHGNPVVTEATPHGLPAMNTSGLTRPGGTVPQHLTGVGGGGGGGAGVGGAGVGGGANLGGGSGGVGSVGVGGTAGVAAAHRGGSQLADGTHVGADNTTANAMSGSAAASPASPVAGAAAGDQAHGGQGSGLGGVPFGGGGARGGAGAQEQESARRYAQRGDLVGEEDLEEWQRMGPVIGEQ
ncbi:MAG TPA: WXG100 family type VII secretion target [Jatrophihabitans sp.]